MGTGTTARALLLLLLAALEGGAASPNIVLRMVVNETLGDMGHCVVGDACEGDTCCLHGPAWAEVRFYSGTAQVTALSATNPGGFNHAGEDANRLIDGLVGSGSGRWMDWQFAVANSTTLEFILDGSGGPLTAFQPFTAGAPPKRWPTGWSVFIQDACGVFVPVAAASRCVPSMARRSAALSWPASPWAACISTSRWRTWVEEG